MTQQSTRRLLLLACSQRKMTTPEMIPALQRYDGPSFQVVRKFLREHPDRGDEPDMYILSAEYGLIHANTAIPVYNRRMTRERAQELAPQLDNVMQHLFQHMYADYCVHAGSLYSQLLMRYCNAAPATTTITVLNGASGRRLAALRYWLYRDVPESAMKAPRTGAVRLRGVDITMSGQQVLELAQQALINDACGAERYHSWYVPVGDRRVAPKWLVSRITGLPVGSFVSDEARRVLAQLGVPVIACPPGYKEADDDNQHEQR